MKQFLQTQYGAVRPAWAAFLLAVVTFVLFAPAIGYDFINYDDDLYVFDNPHVSTGLSLSGLAYAFSTFDGGSWMPLTWISHQLDASLFGVRPAAGHLTNILLHSASAAVVFLALRRMTKCFWGSAFAAAVFACHPLRLESVVCIAERKDVLSVLFFAAGLLAHARYVEKPDGRRRIIIFICLLLGLMSKPMLVTFPFVLLLLDIWPLGRAGKNWVAFRAAFWLLCREKIPLLMLCAFFAVLAFLTQKEAGAVVTLPASLQLKLLRVAENYTFYLYKFFWPAKLSVVYATAQLEYCHAIVCLLLLAALTWLAALWFSRFPWFLTGWLWFLGTLVPVIGLVRIGHITVADRYSYIPSVGLAIMLAWAGLTLVQNKPLLRWLVAVLGVGLLTACAAVTRADLPRWRNSLTLFEDATSKENHEVAYNNLGFSYNARGDFDRGIAACSRALALAPDYTEALNNRGLGYNGRGDFDWAIQDFNRAIELEPTRPTGYNNRGDAHLNKGDFDRAVEDFTAVIRLDPFHVGAWNNRAAARNRQGNYIQAIADASRAIQLNPHYAEAYNNRGNAYSALGNWNRALADYNRAIKLDPSFALAHNNRAAAYFAIKEYERAKADLGRCVQLGGQPHPSLVRDLAEAIRSQTRKGLTPASQ